LVRLGWGPQRFARPICLSFMHPQLHKTFTHQKTLDSWILIISFRHALFSEEKGCSKMASSGSLNLQRLCEFGQNNEPKDSTLSCTADCGRGWAAESLLSCRPMARVVVVPLGNLRDTRPRDHRITKGLLWRQDLIDFQRGYYSHESGQLHPLKRAQRIHRFAVELRLGGIGSAGLVADF